MPVPSRLTLSYLIGILFAFVANSLFVFRTGLCWAKLLPYPSIYGVQYLLGLGILAVGIHWLGIPETLKGLSLETQAQACIEYCRSQSMEVTEVFVERAESASTTDRTELQRMLGYCRTHRGRVHFLVVYMLDRVARNHYDHHALKAYLQKLGITRRAVAQPIDDSVTGKLMDGILAAFNEFDNESSRLWIEAGLAQRQRLQKLFFPSGLSYDGGEFRTPLTCPFFNNFEGTSG